MKRNSPFKRSLPIYLIVIFVQVLSVVARIPSPARMVIDAVLFGVLFLFVAYPVSRTAIKEHWIATAIMILVFSLLEIFMILPSLLLQYVISSLYVDSIIAYTTGFAIIFIAMCLVTRAKKSTIQTRIKTVVAVGLLFSVVFGVLNIISTDMTDIFPFLGTEASVMDMFGFFEGSYLYGLYIVSALLKSIWVYSTMLLASFTLKW